jgi:hypothetical protein
MTKEALKLALEALEGADNIDVDMQAAIVKCREALAQPVQEPVACRFCHSKKGCYTWLCYSCGEIDDVQQPAPLPLQEPLTHDEIETIGDKVANEQLVGPVANFRVRFARAIEAAHGIKEKT